MGNKDKNKIIRIYGVTLPESKFRVRPYGHGTSDIEVEGEILRVSYVDYFIEDIIDLIKQQEKVKEFLKGL